MPLGPFLAALAFGNNFILGKELRCGMGKTFLGQ